VAKPLIVDTERGPLPSATPDRDFISRVLPHFSCVEYDIDEVGARVRWIVDGAAVQLEVSWSSNVSAVSIVIVPKNQRRVLRDTSSWDLKSNGEGQSKWTWTAKSKIDYQGGHQFSAGDWRTVARFQTSGWSWTSISFADHAREYRVLIEKMVRRVLASCAPFEPVTGPPFPEMPRLIDLEFSAMKTFTNGLIKRPVV
jgi:hypothetical protein